MKLERNDMKTPYVLCFFCGAALMFAYTTLAGSNSRPHVYELRMYHVNRDKMDALKARFRDHTDTIFTRHNMKSIGYWQPEDAPSSQNSVHLHFGASESRRSEEELGRVP